MKSKVDKGKCAAFCGKFPHPGAVRVQAPGYSASKPLEDQKKNQRASLLVSDERVCNPGRIGCFPTSPGSGSLGELSARQNLRHEAKTRNVSSYVLSETWISDIVR